MYNGGYGGTPSGFSIHNYAPMDPMAGMPGFPAAPPQPQQVPPAPSQRSQSSGSSANVNQNPGGRPRVSTEDMRRDFARSAVYIPTPINNMNIGAGSLVPASQRTPAPPAVSANQRGTNQQRPLPQNHPMNQVQMFQHQMQQILNHDQTQSFSQNILASLQGMAMQGNEARPHIVPLGASGTPVRYPPVPQGPQQNQMAQQAGSGVQQMRPPPGPPQRNNPIVPHVRAPRPPPPRTGQPEPHPGYPGTIRVQEIPAIYVFEEGNVYYDNFLIVENQFVNLMHFVEHISATRLPMSEAAAREIRRRLPQTHRLRVGSEPSPNHPIPQHQNPPAPPAPHNLQRGNSGVPRAPPAQGPSPQHRNQNPQMMNFPQPAPPHLQHLFQIPNGVSPEEIQRYHQAHQHQLQRIQQQVAQHAAQGQNAQQMMQFHHQQQQEQQAPQRRPEQQNCQQPPQPQQAPPQPQSAANSAQPIQDEVAAENRVGISADERAPPCAYSPSNSPIPETKPVVRIPDKAPKPKKHIEVVTLEDDEPLVTVKTEPRDVVSSTSDDRNVCQQPNRAAGDQQPQPDPSESSLQNVTVKTEPLERVIAIVQQMENRGQGSSNAGQETRDENEDQRILNKALSLIRTMMALPPELRHPDFRAAMEEPNVQESKVTTTELKTVKESRSRSTSPDSDIITLRRKKKVIDDELSDDPYEADQPSTSAGRVESRASTSKNEPTRREKRPVISDDSDDDMPVVQKKKRGMNRKSSEEEEWQDDGNNSSEEDWNNEDFLERDDEEEEEEEEDDIRNFIVDDDEEEYEEDSDEETSKRRKDKKKKEKERDRSRRPRRERERTSSPPPARTVQRSKSVNDRRRESSPPQPLTAEEKRRLRNEKTRRTREDNREKARLARLQQQSEMYATINRRIAEVPQSSAIKEYHQSNKRDPKPTTEKPRREAEKKRTTPSASEELDDEGVHVPAKRMAHSNSVPGTSRDRPSSSSARNRPSQRDIDVKRYAEAEAKKEKERKEYEDLKKKPHPTEGERMRLMKLKSVFDPKPAPRPTTSKPQMTAKPSSKPSTSNPSVMKTIKQEFLVREPPRDPTPPPLDRSQGSNFASARKTAIKSIYKYLLEGERPNPVKEAQKVELELAKKCRDAAKYQSAVRSKLAELNRANKSGIMEVNPNAVSHSQILSGAPKENCLVAKGRKIHVDHRTLSFEQLQPLLLPFKMSDSELETNAYPLFPAGSRVAKIAETAYTLNKKMFLDAHDLSRSCSRCQKEFKLNPDGTMVREKDICRYHHRGTNRNGKRDTFQKRYTCCNEEYNSTPGCKFSDVHVFDQLFKKDLSAFVPTPPAHSPNDYRSNKAYAIDCEMVYTVSGPALARLTMVNLKKEKVLDLFIKPPTEVLDPNTEFSGLTMEDIANAKDTMESCHQKLFQLVNSETILIGHSLESDLKAMRIVHKSVIDTAILFRSSGDFKIALKNLSSRLLGKTIQGDNEDAVGHDSLEDANTCVDLIFYGLKNPDSIVIRKLSS